MERVEVIEGPGGRKKGFGTVRFLNEKDATDAIEKLDGVEFQGVSSRCASMKRLVK